MKKEGGGLGLGEEWRGSGEELGDGGGEAGEDVFRGEGVGFFEVGDDGAGFEDGDGLGFGIDDPDEFGAGGEVLGDFFLDIVPDVEGGENFDGEVGRAAEELRSRVAGGNAGGGDKRNVWAADGVGGFGGDEAGFGQDVAEGVFLNVLQEERSDDDGGAAVIVIGGRHGAILSFDKFGARCGCGLFKELAGRYLADGTHRLPRRSV
jgi:hypothetical protein